MDLSSLTNQTNDAHFRKMMEQAPLSISVLSGPDFRIHFANKKLLRIWEKTEAEVLNQPLFTVFSELDHSSFKEQLTQVYNSGKPVHGSEVPSKLQRDGELVEGWYDFSYEPFFDASGKIEGIIAISNDVTEKVRYRKQIEENEEKYRNLFEKIDEGFCIVDMIYDENNRPVDYCFIETNPRFEEQTGLVNARGRRVSELVPDLEGHWFEIYGRVATTGESIRFVEGSEAMGRWFEVFAYKLGDTSSKRVVLLFRDITERKQSEEKLRASEQRYIDIYDTVPVSIWVEDFSAVKNFLDSLSAQGITDLDHYFSREHATLQQLVGSVVIKDVNQAALDLFGGSKEELLQGLNDFFVEDTLPAFLEELKLIFKGGGRFVMETVVRRKSGEVIHVLARIEFPRHSDYSNVYVTLINIDARKKAELALMESEARFRNLADNVPMWVWLSDESANIIYVNKEELSFFGLQTAEEFLGKAWEKSLHPEDVAHVYQVYSEAISNHAPYALEARMYNQKTGDYEWFYFRGVPRMEDGSFRGIIGTAINIHHQKLLTEKLEQLVDDRTRELQRSNADLQQFAHVASHDLKEPVRKIRVYQNRLEEEFSAQIPERGKEYLRKIENAATRMHSMIDGVLAYSLLDATLSVKEKVALQPLVQNILSDLELLIDQKKATVNLGTLPEVRGIQVLLHQLFYNLVNNALKFSKPGRDPQISITESDTDNNELATIVVADNGIGFSDEEKEVIFSTFTRLHPRDQYEGTGLGLSLCKKIVERHGGTIEAKGKENEGAMFFIRLPRFRESLQ